MVIDTSALVALLTGEAATDALTRALSRAPVCYVSTATLVEAGIVIHARLGDHGERELDLLVQRCGIIPVPVSESQAEGARRAYRQFGKGRHPAALNFGDCFSYALAVELDQPLLFVGDDFAKTDVRTALEL